LLVSRLRIEGQNHEIPFLRDTSKKAGGQPWW